MRMLILIVLLVSAWFLLNEFLGFDAWDWFINNTPYVGPAVDSTFTFLRTPSPEGVLAYSFLSKSILPAPLEPYWIWVNSQGVNIFWIILMGSIGGTIGALFSYAIGSVLRTKFIKEEKFFAARESGIGSWVLVFGSTILPIPDITSVIFGAYRVSLRIFLSAHFIGMILKVILVFYALDYVGGTQALTSLPFF